MARYIDADKIPYFHYSGNDTAAEGVNYTLKGVIESRVPTEDVAPVVHGHWDDTFDGITPVCSVCGMTHRVFVRCPNYCPHCGAKMDL